MCIRNLTNLKFEDLNTDVKKKFDNYHQPLFKIHKIRNRYYIEGMLPENPLHDIDDFYLEAGEPTLPPVEMCERMYSVVRFMQFKQDLGSHDFLLKKNDVIKMGRVKVKVKHIHNQNKVKVREQRQKRRLERLELEKIKGEEVKEGGERRSKYPENYENIPMGSDMSYYHPIVGEVNYVEAVLPPPPVPPAPVPQKVEKKPKKDSEPIDVIAPRA